MREIFFTIEGMDCISCIGGIEATLKRERGVHEVEIAFPSGATRLTFEGSEEELEALFGLVERMGYAVRRKEETHSDEVKKERQVAYRKHLILFVVGAFLSLPLFIQMILHPFLPHFQLSGWVQFLLSTLVQFGVGWPFYLSTFHALRRGRANMDTLIALGTTTAYLYSFIVFFFSFSAPLYFDGAAIIITILSLGRFLEAFSIRAASEAVEALLALRPQQALVEREGRREEIPLEEVVVGDQIILLPGSSIPVDAKVVEGSSSVNEAMLTGESLPVTKREGDLLFAGTENGEGFLKAEAVEVGEKTALAAIAALVEKAQNSKAPIQRIADRVAGIFVPIVLLLAALTFFLFWLLGGEVFPAILNAVSVLIISCPCALGLATPIVMMVASSLASKAGILIKDAATLEMAAHLDVLVLDKTGTLTEGKPTVAHFLPLAGDSQELLSWTRSLEGKSEHPLAKALVAYAEEKGGQEVPVEGFQALKGRGVEGQVAGQRLHLGSINLLQEEGIEPPSQAKELLQKGYSLAALWSERELFALFAISDPVREGAVELIQEIKALNIEPMLVTGDRKESAALIAEQLDLSKVVAEALPEEKVKQITRLREGGKRVGMVGDGINDAPALAEADVGFAIGAGSNIAAQASDITLLTHELASLTQTLCLSRATLRKMRQNLFFAFFYNCVAIPVAAVGLLNPVIAGAAMALSSLSVVFNALFLRLPRPHSF